MKRSEGSEIKQNSIYATILQKILNNRKIDITGQEPLANLSYRDEIEFKQTSLLEYWELQSINGSPSPIIPSPKERFYRTTSKRRVLAKQGKFYLLFNQKSMTPGTLYNRSSLEPADHSKIYDYISRIVNEPAYKLIGNSLNYLIIKGSYTEIAVIFNVHKLNAEIVRKLKKISDLMKNVNEKIISSFIYLDPKRSEYYLENERPNDLVNFKKLFGPEHLFLKTDSRKYSYHPTSFSQVNESMIPILLSEAKRMLNPESTHRFYDLYCGYGLFSLNFADEFSSIMGIEIEGKSIDSARTNARFNKSSAKIKFISANISGDTLKQILPVPSPNELFLLDPPRQGTEKNVIKVIAQRNPSKILHIFCGIEEIKRETQKWENYGYQISEVQPLDMFPGTPNLEILILLEQNSN